MKSKYVSRAVALWTALVCLTLPACESSQEAAEQPGEPPRMVDAPIPRLNAATFAAHGELLERRGEYARAAEQYRKALEIAPQLTSTRNRLGVTLNKLGEHAAATQAFKLAIAAQPDQPFLQNNLGFSLYLEGNYAEAADVLQRAIELDPSFRRARMNYGVVLAQLERYEDALEQFSEAGPLADAHFNLGIVQAQKGAYVAAASSFEQALANDPDLDAARDQLRQIARLTAVEESGGSESYAGGTIDTDAGFAEATPPPAPLPTAPDVEATSTIEPSAVVEQPTEVFASPPPPVASNVIDERYIETVDTPVEEPTDVGRSVSPPANDSRSSAAPPTDAVDRPLAAHRQAPLPSTPDFASLALDRDPWAEFFVAAPKPQRVAPR